MTRTVAVTGAGGFIGSAIVRELRQRRIGVRAHLGLPGAPFHPPPDDVGAAFFDIEDCAALVHLFEGVDAVIHAAGPPSVRASFADPVGFVRVHTVGTAAVLDAMRSANVQHLVTISSAEVYGRPAGSLASENDRPEPRSPYGAAKLAAESVVRGAARSFGLTACILRPFSVYGPGMSPASLVGAVIAQSAASDTILVDDVAPVRDYCYVDDLAEAAAMAALAPTDDVSLLNIASGVPTGVPDLVRAIGRVIGRDLVLRERVGNKRPADAEIYRLVADTTAAQERFGWKPRYSLDGGLRRTREAFVPA